MYEFLICIIVIGLGVTLGMSLYAWIVLKFMTSDKGVKLLYRFTKKIEKKAKKIDQKDSDD